jgi:hypothetical protein
LKKNFTALWIAVKFPTAEREPGEGSHRLFAFS